MWGQAVEAELSVIGAALQDASVVQAVLGLTPEAFTDPGLQVIFKAIRRLNDSGIPVDLTTISHELRALASGEAHHSALLVQCVSAMQQTPTTGNTPHYVGIVKELSARRQLFKLCDGIKEAATREDCDLNQVLAKAMGRLWELNPSANEEKTSAQAVTLSGYEYAQRMAEGDGRAGMTGIPEIDRDMGGLHRGELTILAARPGVGKTTLAQQITDSFAKRGQRVLFVSCEMSHEQLAVRWFARYGVSPGHIRHGTMTDSDWAKLSDALPEMSKRPINVHTRLRTPGEIGAWIQRYKKAGGLGLVVIDYLQLLRSGRRTQNANGEVAEISRQLKELTIAHHIPILCLSQLSREAARRKQCFHVLTDLRDSGAIEQDADNVLFLARPEEESQLPRLDREDFLRSLEEGNRLIYLQIEKQRQGPTGRHKMVLRPKDMQLYSLASPVPVNSPTMIKEWNKDD